jgi:hypothetical protein
MSTNLPALRFIGHGGERYQPKNAVDRVMFIPDAKLVLSLRSKHHKGRDLKKRLLWVDSRQLPQSAHSVSTGKTRHRFPAYRP